MGLLISLLFLSLSFTRHLYSLWRREGWCDISTVLSVLLFSCLVEDIFIMMVCPV